MSTNNPNNVVREVSNIIKKPVVMHNEAVKSQHWQLKNVLKLDGKHLMFPNDYSVEVYDYNTKVKEKIIKKLRFSPTSLFVNDEYIAVGGPRGQVLLVNRITENKSTITLTEAINNHILIHENRLYVSNNDKTLKIFDMNLKLIKTIDHSTQVNFCCISPDNKYLMIVGDNNEVVIYSKHDHQLIKKLRTIKDGGFSISWNSTSDMFGVATQDGYVCLWDVRSDEKLHILSSTQFGSHKGAIRNVFFTVKNSLDLLCFTEQMNYLTLFDTRTFAKKQVLKLFNEINITGAVYLEDKAKIFVSSELGIAELDVNTVSRRIFDE